MRFLIFEMDIENFFDSDTEGAEARVTAPSGGTGKVYEANSKISSQESPLP